MVVLFICYLFIYISNFAKSHYAQHISIIIILIIYLGLPEYLFLNSFHKSLWLLSVNMLSQSLLNKTLTQTLH